MSASDELPQTKPLTQKQGGFRQAMTWVHTWAGLTLGWVLYLMFVTGTAGYFDTEIDRWMQPELPAVKTAPSLSQTAATIVARMTQTAPGAERWYISLPADRNQPYPNVFWQGASIEDGAESERGRLLLDAQTGKKLTPRDTGGGQTLYQMHWRLHYLPRSYSDWLIGIATLFMMVGLVSGIIIHKKIFVDFFTFRLNKGQRSWLDAHNFLSVFALPFHLMITYSGLLFLGFSLMPFIVASQYPEDGRRQFYADVFDPPGIVEPAGQNTELTPLEPLIERVQDRWGQGRIRSMDVRHPGDANARIVFTETIDDTVATGGETLVFNGASGEHLHTEAADASAAKQVRDVFLGLHEGLFAKPILRWLYFLSGLLGTGMVATGLILWTTKRRQKAERKSGPAPKGLRLVEMLNAGTIVGLPVGIAAYFAANRLLPIGIAGRAGWEVNVLFITWFVMLIHSTCRPRQYVWQEQLAIGALAYSALPLLNALTTDRHLAQSLPAGDWVFAGVDLTLLAIGLIFAWAARRVHHLKTRKADPKTTHRGRTA